MIQRYSQLSHKLIAFHGTDENPFEEFKQLPGKIVTIFGREPIERTGFFFTTSFEKAKKFGNNVVKVSLDMQNPLDFTSTSSFAPVADILEKKGWNPKWLWNIETWEMFDGEDGKNFVKEIISLGYDSVIFEEPNVDDRGGRAFIVFSPQQIEILEWKR